LSSDYKAYLIKEDEKRKKIEQFEKEIKQLKNDSLEKANNKIKEI
jgi:hypothetical protein